MLNLKFQHPFTCICSSVTKSGKTQLVKRLILCSREMIEPEPELIYWAYTEWQPAYEQLNKEMQGRVKFIEGLPDFDELKVNKNKTQLLVLDDLMQSMSKKDDQLVQLFTRGAHYWNLSIIHIVQNLFFGGLRTSRINAQYLILLKNPADKLQIQTLQRQIFPGSHHFLESFEDATTEPYGYLLVDLTPTTPEQYRLRTHIFPDEMQIVYIPKK